MLVIIAIFVISIVYATYYLISIGYTLFVSVTAYTMHQLTGSPINWLYSLAVLIDDIVLSQCLSAFSSVSHPVSILSFIAIAVMCAVLLFIDPVVLISMSIFITSHFLIYNCYYYNINY